jgi:hypothetical protein
LGTILGDAVAHHFDVPQLLDVLVDHLAWPAVLITHHRRTGLQRDNLFRINRLSLLVTEDKGMTMAIVGECMRMRCNAAVVATRSTTNRLGLR